MLHSEAAKRKGAGNRSRNPADISTSAACPRPPYKLAAPLSFLPLGFPMKPPAVTEMFLKQALYVGYSDCLVLNFKITTALLEQFASGSSGQPWGGDRNKRGAGVWSCHLGGSTEEKWNDREEASSRSTSSHSILPNIRSFVTEARIRTRTF